jgi:hypothetical protein
VAVAFDNSGNAVVVTLENVLGSYYQAMVVARFQLPLVDGMRVAADTDAQVAMRLRLFDLTQADPYNTLERILVHRVTGQLLVRSMSRSSGTQVWTYDLDAWVATHAALVPAPGELLVLDAAQQTLLMHERLPGLYYSSQRMGLAVSSGGVVLVRGDNALYALVPYIAVSGLPQEAVIQAGTLYVVAVQPSMPVVGGALTLTLTDGGAAAAPAELHGADGDPSDDRVQPRHERRRGRARRALLRAPVRAGVDARDGGGRLRPALPAEDIRRHVADGPARLQRRRAGVPRRAAPHAPPGARRRRRSSSGARATSPARPSPCSCRT